jgi:hypothetical protein
MSVTIVVLRPPLLACLTAVLLMLSGCGQQEGGRPPGDSTHTRIPAPIPSRDSISTADSASATRAVAWIQDYYRAINEHRYRDAYAHWERGGLASGKSFDAFRKGFVSTDQVEVTVGTPGRVEGAAGSRYVEVPVRIAARTRDGALQNYSGSYTLRLSVVDGATSEQRSWHIYSAAVRRLN